MQVPRARASVLVAAISAIIFFSRPAAAQSPNASLHIEVKDPSGLAVQASGKLENLGGGSSRPFQTNSDGVYNLGDLSAGRYRLEISETGFATQSIVIRYRGEPISRVVTLALATQATQIDVVAPTPLPGTDIPLDEIAAPVQTRNARGLEQSGLLDLADLLNRQLNAVHINQNQGNPFQPDINYRGYTASPLLGTPEGISVYMGGVRQNQPFGDIVAWDLIPKIAISEVALMPGSNPLFGLNTLGGALSVQTKDGYSAPGLGMEVSGGSFGRRQGELEYSAPTQRV
jgi:outer membrane receptor protein involved in Fe transport